MLLDHCQSIWGGGHFLKDMEAIDHTVYPPAKGGEGGPTQGLKMAQATSSFQGLSLRFWTPPPTPLLPPLPHPSHVDFFCPTLQIQVSLCIGLKYLDEKTRNLCPPICNLVSYRFFFCKLFSIRKARRFESLEF